MANEPITRNEKFMRAVATGEPANIEPITREELFLAKAAGQDVETPTPITRKEHFLQKIIENGGSGGGDGDAIPADRYFEGDHEIMILPNANKIGRYGICNNSYLKYIEMPKVTIIKDGAFENDVSLGEILLPSELTSIETRAFYGCRSLVINSIPEKVEIVGNFAFYGCGGLRQITFEGTPTSIGGSTFNNCLNLTTINVPWAEGQIPYAPWGATQATINYNYTGE